ncbi:MAG TPA: thiol:disulfide interchange protein DsbA/DsbL [Hydrogenophaga sp.]|uniref:thiol:disulfide interchange protein DsbA/DsbL n=1 Tax=Hydrogenophaga sp. TaxID=1904254 RepID=UPI002C4D6EB2|nr:thiol:disulfide interchange protein DsbA/DsbL [Hydrogenophaga sp.]HMN92872.1 thiol:disulfide interchange protein DsbA/DsbL [Hydrogenophaga sp.]HMP10899.1 thiol:disulfide interchange protein DsbA/DsbL [Hydrogenophaga sp.]
MLRRDFSRAFVASSALASLTAWPLTVRAQGPAALREGRDYVRLARPAPVDAQAGQIEVLEFFAYTCIHCYNFEPLFEDWKKGIRSDVLVRRVPVAFSEAFVPLQRLYYALEGMGQLDALHRRVFQAIHEDKQRLSNAETIVAWVGKQGVDTKKFTEFYNSFAVAGKTRRAVQLQDAYQVEGTPSLGIAGRFYVSGQGPRTLVIANALIDQLRRG